MIGQAEYAKIVSERLRVTPFNSLPLTAYRLPLTAYRLPLTGVSGTRIS